MNVKTACQFENDKNLVVLRELTNNLKPPGFTEAPNGSGHYANIDIGSDFVRTILKNAKISVADSHMRAGTEFPAHVHNEWEVVLVYQGELHLMIDDVLHVMKPKDVRTIEANVIHSAKVSVDTGVITATIPPTEDWPDEVKK